MTIPVKMFVSKYSYYLKVNTHRTLESCADPGNPENIYVSILFEVHIANRFIE